MLKKILLSTIAMSIFTAAAQDVKVGLSAEPTSIDPHYHDAFYNTSVLFNLYDGLITLDDTMQVQPGLAESWEIVSPTVWRFKLRDGVKFHDGSTFGAEDVIYSIRRIKDGHVINSPSPFTTYVSTISDIRDMGSNVIEIETAGPDPVLLNNLSFVGIISSPKDDIKFVEADDPIDTWPESLEFNEGKLAIGTGPYKFKSFKTGDQLVLEKNADYWGGAPAADTAYLYPMPDNGARTAALISGQVQVIDAVPVADIYRIDENENLGLVSAPSAITIFFMFDQFGEKTPKIEGKNPFLDQRVRKAFLQAIDRDTILENIMENIAEPADQMIPPTMHGYATDYVRPPYDPEAAKALLAEAGYPDGFKMTINAPNDRYVNDEKTAQAIAQMLARIGVDAAVETFPRSVYFTNASNFDFSLYMGATGAETGDASKALAAMVHSRDLDNGWGGGNRGRYANPKADALIEEAFKTVDAAQRYAMYAEASKLFAEDVATIPLYHVVGVFGTSKDVNFTPRMDQRMHLPNITFNN